MIHLLYEKKNDVERLFESVAMQENDTHQTSSVSCENFSICLNSRFAEYNTFIHQRKQLSMIAHQLQFVNIIG